MSKYIKLDDAIDIVTRIQGNGECCVYWLEDAYWARRDIEQEHIVAWKELPPAYKVERSE